MRGIIVIDGPDACGKTTLAANFELYCKDNGIPFLYQHARYRFQNRMFQYHEAIVRKAIKFSEQGLAVIDRLHWSEYVYAKVYRGGSKWPLQWRYFDRLLQKYAALNIICCGSSTAQVFEWHKKAKREREEMYKSDGRIQELAAEYIKIYNERYYRSDYFFYDRSLHPDQPSVYETVKYLLGVVENMRAEQLPVALETSCYNLLGYVPRADILFVGDELNNKGRHQIWPFWEYAHSSLFMTEILDEIGFDETRAVWTNYNTAGQKEFYIDALLEYNKNLRVITLGNPHWVKLRSAGIKCDKVHHPSYAKRFNFKEYARMIADATAL